MRPSVRTPLTALAAAATLVSGLALLPTVANADEGNGERGTTRSAKLVGLLAGGTELVTFKAGSADEVRRLGTVTLSGSDARLVGIDWRVQDRSVYGVGDAGGVYRISVDERVNPGGTTLADTALSTPPGAGTTTGVVAAAYTNNDLSSATATTLFDVTAAGALVVQSPANSGLLAAVGGLGVGATPDAAFDIRTRVGEDGTVNTGFAALTASGVRGLYAVNVLSGRATLLGSLGAAVDDLTAVG